MFSDRTHFNPNFHLSLANTLSIGEGGTGATNLEQAQKNLDILPKEKLGVKDGAAVKPVNGNYGVLIEGGSLGTVTVIGPQVIKANQLNTLFISNYDIQTEYVVSCTLGTITRDYDTLYLQTTKEIGVCEVTINEVKFSIAVVKPTLFQPTIVYPVEPAKDINSRVSVQSSAFNTLEFNTFHKSSDWQLASDRDFKQIVKTLEADEQHLTQWDLEALAEKTKYFVRVRYRDNLTNETEWSLPIELTTRDSFAPVRPAIQAPAYNSIDNNSDVELVSSDFETHEEFVSHSRSDWEVSTSLKFLGTVAKLTEDETHLTKWTVTDLKPATLYYVRVRYYDNKDRVSEWSSTHRFMTKATFSAETPKIISPDDGISEQYSSVDVVSTPFKHSNSKVTHVSSDWEASEDPTFAYPSIKAYSSATELVQWKVSKLTPLTKYYVRTRYRDSEGFVSEWSKGVSFTTKSTFAPRRPTISFPSNGAIDGTYTMAFQASVFSSQDLGDEHLNSDWELASNIGFTNIVKTAEASANNKTSWTVNSLSSHPLYFLRVRYRSIKDGVSYTSEWSAAVSFSVQQVLPGTPGIMTPVNGQKDIDPVLVNFTASAFVAGEPGETHSNSDWQLSTSNTFGSLLKTANASTAYKTSWAVADLPTDGTFYVRVKYRSTLGSESAWSPVTSFGSKKGFIATAPAVTQPSNGATNVSVDSVKMTSTSFVFADGDDAHLNSDWELSTDPSFSSTEFSSYASEADRTSWTVFTLNANTTYYARVRHRGSNSGDTPWSDGSSFTTKEEVVATGPDTPTITDPSDGATGKPTTITIRASAFSTGTSGDIHKNSDWELSSDSGFSNIVKSVNASASYKTSWSLAGISDNTTFYVRVRYNSALGTSSDWSPAVGFGTGTAAGGGGGGGGSSSNAPTIITPSNGDSVLPTVTLVASAFVPTSAATHTSSIWVLATDLSFSTIIRSATRNTGDLTAWMPPALVDGTSYAVKVQYVDSTDTATDWSAGVTFTVDSTAGADRAVPPAIDFVGITSDTKIPFFDGMQVPSLEPVLSFTPWESKNSALGSFKMISYELATDSQFTTKVVYGYDNVLFLGLLYLKSFVTDSTTYYFRAKWKGTTGSYSPWYTCSFYVGTSTGGGGGGSTDPSTPKWISPSPANNSTVSPANFKVQLSPFSSASGDTHASTSWIVKDLTNNKTYPFDKSTKYMTSIGPVDLPAGLSVSITAKYHGVSGAVSGVSETLNFKTKASSASVNTPTIISPTNNFSLPAVNTGITLLISAFSTSNTLYGHYSTEIRLSTTQVWDDGAQTYSISFAGDILKDATGRQTLFVSFDDIPLFEFGTMLYMQVRHLATDMSASNWTASTVGVFLSQSRPDKEAAFIAPATYSPTDEFAASLALSTKATVIAVGAPKAGNGQGTVYLFRNASSTPSTQTPVLDSLANGKPARFGTSVGLSNDGKRLVVGAPGSSGANAILPGVHVFDIDASGNAWRRFRGAGNTDPEILRPTEGSPYQTFATVMAISGDGKVVVVGGSGAVDIFRADPSTGWYGAPQRLSAPAGTYGRYGDSVAVNNDGSIIYVGQPLGNVVYKYSYAGGTYTLHSQKTITGGGAGVATNSDGSVVALTGTKTVSIAVVHDPNPPGQNVGPFLAKYTTHETVVRSCLYYGVWAGTLKEKEFIYAGSGQMVSVSKTAEGFFATNQTTRVTAALDAVEKMVAFVGYESSASISNPRSGTYAQSIALSPDGLYCLFASNNSGAILYKQ